MDKIKFNLEGNLPQAEAMELELAEIRQYFVDAFPGSGTRGKLFRHFEGYLERFQKEVYHWFEVWVDGSFVTDKLNPKDIDFVVLLEGEVFEKRGKILDGFYSFSLETQGLDAFILPVYPENHRNFVNFVAKKEALFRLFSTDRNKNQKGFLRLVFKRKVS